MKKEKLHKSEENLCNWTLQSGLGCPTPGSNRSQHGTKSLSTRTRADSFHNDQLLSCLISSPGWLLATLVHGTPWHRQNGHWRSGPWHPCTVSAQKNITVKADTHSHIYSHIQTGQQQNWKLTKLLVQVLNSTIHRLQEVISMASSLRSVQQWLLTSSPLQIPSEQDSAERSKSWNEYLFNPLCDNKLQTKESISQYIKPINKHDYKVFLPTEIGTDINFKPIQSSLHYLTS